MAAHHVGGGTGTDAEHEDTMTNHNAPLATTIFAPGVQASVLAPEDLARLASLTTLLGSHSSREALLAAPRLDEVEVLVTGWGAPQLDADLLGRMPALGLVLFAAGSVRHVTTEESWARGVRIVSAADVNNDPVAEFVIATTVLALKGAHRSEAHLRATRSLLASHADLGIYDRRIGLVGFGSIARKVAAGLQRFGHQVAVWDPYLDAADAAASGVVAVETLGDVFDGSAVVSIHAPWLPGTNEGMIGRAELEAMPEGATLVNTARGALVDEPALIEVLRQRPDLHAVLDVTWPEPPEAGSPLYELPNVRLTGHVAGSIGREQQRLGRLVVDELERWRSGQPLRHEVTEQDAKLRA